jgi:hypothetical protein
MSAVADRLYAAVGAKPGETILRSLQRSARQQKHCIDRWLTQNEQPMPLGGLVFGPRGAELVAEVQSALAMSGRDGCPTRSIVPAFISISSVRYNESFR